MNATRRLLPRAVLATAFAAAIVLVVATHNPVAAQNPNLKPNYGWLRLTAGFDPDPVRIGIVAGGNVETAKGGVKAYVSQSPDFSIEYKAGNPPLTFYVTSGEDTTLLISLPDGTWVADDDSGGNLNPLVKINNPKSGRYDVWVGTVAKDKSPKAILHVTELK